MTSAAHFKSYDTRNSDNYCMSILFSTVCIYPF